ncbi:MAG: tripartite tricarboxylate transporter substrate binding protein [Lachnospiraceae bacterium]|nr:tripartite tricarboxylate transporter substrate binding protein [Lachnospiraceae bacterium]
MKKRLVSLVLAGVMAMVSLAGCSSQGSTQTTAASTQESAESAAETKAEEAVSDTKWPEEPVQIIVGANAGGGIDTAARLIAKYMEKYLGQSFVVTNEAGGAGSIAATDVKNAKADGSTFLVAHEALLTNKISGTTDFDYDGFDCGGIPFKVYTTCLLSKKYSSIEELTEAAKAAPSTVKFGTELATNDTAIIAMMEEKEDVKFQLVDAGAVSDQIASMMGNHIDFMKAPVGLAKDYVASGDFKILAFFNEERNQDYPDVPTMKEEGVDFVVDKYFGCFFPKNTDPAIIEKFSKTLEEICKDPEFLSDAKNVSYAVDYVTPADMPAYFENCKVRLVEYQNLLENHFAK